MLSIIAVIGRNRELGKDNKLLWHVPGDLPRFKRITEGHPVIMGRKTFLSIGKPLSNRTNIVVSSDNGYISEGIIVVQNLKQAMEIAMKSPGHEEIFVIGGGSVYTQTIDLAEKLYLTVVDKEAEADTFFPDYSKFQTIISDETHQNNGYTFRYLTLTR